MSLTTIPQYLKHWSTIEPDRPAFIFLDANHRRRAYSRKDIFELSAKYAAKLHREGITRGDVVCNTLPNSPERLITDFGCALAGAIALNGQVFLADGNDFCGSLKKANCRAVIIDPDVPKGAKEIMERHVHKQHGSHVSYPELPSLRLVLACYWETHDDKVALLEYIEKETEQYVDDVEPDDDVYVFTTSGSTGFSKLVPRTHEELIYSAKCFTEMLRVEDGEIYYNDRPLGWGGGYPYAYVTCGITRVLTDQSKGYPEDSFKFMWDLVCQEKCVSAFMVPYHLERVTHSLDTWKNSGRQFRVVASGGQPLKKVHMDAIGKVTDAVVACYGSTEAMIISSKVVTDPATYEDCNNGPLMTGVEAKVVDKELKEVAAGEMGEFLIRSKMVCREYLANEKATAESFLPDGWFRTGDIGYFTKDGEAYVICREKFAIMHGSYVIYPGWLEVRILECPGIQSVVIVPVPDAVLYQEICACLVRKPGSNVTEEEVNNFCKTLFLTRQSSEMTAVPKYYLFFSQFPTTSTGKVCRNSLTKEALRILGMAQNGV